MSKLKIDINEPTEGAIYKKTKSPMTTVWDWYIMHVAGVYLWKNNMSSGIDGIACIYLKQ